eukprot:6081083-Prymnesium_polylepis.1
MASLRVCHVPTAIENRYTIATANIVAHGLGTSVATRGQSPPTSYVYVTLRYGFLLSIQNMKPPRDAAGRRGVQAAARDE